ncbi:response regulator [Caballeronia sp. BCC1704]|uniref:response regulator n=1 Tax=Caballeronia sp. BCC1704 TaxID=2676300 RepID=UPI001589C405|nr:response regulator [Caballeronia sp. BCC1704]
MFSHRASHWSNRIVARRHAPVLRILLVDDYEPGAEAVTAALLADGYEVRCVFSGRTALELVDKWVPDIAVLDINMPEMDGLELAFRLRQRLATHDIGMIAFTALDESAVRASNFAASFDAYCQKAGSPAMLLSIIMRMLR